MLLAVSSQLMAEPCEAQGAAGKFSQNMWLVPTANTVSGQEERFYGGS